MDPAGVSFAFRPLWQLSAAEQAGVALSKAQTSAVYAGLQLWPTATTAALVRSQLLEDGTYPEQEAAFASPDAATDPACTDPQWAQSVVTPGRGGLVLHPSRVVRFLGNPLPEGIGYVDDILSEGEEAVAAKYTDDFTRSVYNPDDIPGCSHSEVEDTLEEPTKRADRFEQGVVIVTNSEQTPAAKDW